jgi:hypothetical protein
MVAVLMVAVLMVAVLMVAVLMVAPVGGWSSRSGRRTLASVR